MANITLQYNLSTVSAYDELTQVASIDMPADDIRQFIDVTLLYLVDQLETYPLDFLKVELEETPSDLVLERVYTVTTYRNLAVAAYPDEPV